MPPTSPDARSTIAWLLLILLGLAGLALLLQPWLGQIGWVPPSLG